MNKHREAIDLGGARAETQGQGLLVADEIGKRNQTGLDREATTVGAARTSTRGMGFLIADEVGKRNSTGLMSD